MHRVKPALAGMHLGRVYLLKASRTSGTGFPLEGVWGSEPGISAQGSVFGDVGHERSTGTKLKCTIGCKEYVNMP